MTKVNCFALRPGTIFVFRDEKFRVLSNDTLLQQFRVESLDRRGHTRSFHYAAGMEISVRWKPDRRI